MSSTCISACSTENSWKKWRRREQRRLVFQRRRQPFFPEPSSEGMSVFDGGGTAGSPVTGSSSIGSEVSFWWFADCISPYAHCPNNNKDRRITSTSIAQKKKKSFLFVCMYCGKLTTCKYSAVTPDIVFARYSGIFSLMWLNGNGHRQFSCVRWLNTILLSPTKVLSMK